MTIRIKGPVRLSSVILLKRNLLDPLIYIPAVLTYVFCLAVGRHLSSLTFLLLFTSITWLIQRHIDSYRSFRVTRRWTRALESEQRFVAAFLRANSPDEHKAQLGRLVGGQPDTFLWVNKIINYFWPYLSHVVHHELNEFLAHSGSLSRSKAGLKRFLYAMVRQLDANILAIERCELGARAPFIKSLRVFDEGAKDKSMIYDVDLFYEGNMNMSFICRYCCCCSSRVGFKDVFVHLRSRLAIGPIDPAEPFVEALSFSLLELPAFGYRGIAMVELAELKIAKRSLNRAIKDHLLFPKQLRITTAELQEKLAGRQQAAQEAAARRQASELVGSPASSNGLPARRPPFFARCLAQLAYFTCLCSNGCLRCCCQRERLRGAERTIDDSGSNNNNADEDNSRATVASERSK